MDSTANESTGQARPIEPPVVAGRPRRPRWLTTMAWLGLITALLWLAVAFLIGVALALMAMAESLDPQLAVDIPIGQETREQLIWMTTLYVASGLWLIAAAWTAFAGRYLTRFLHNALAIVRIVLLILWAVDVASGGGPEPGATVGSAESFSTTTLIGMAVLELIYPVAILIVFNKPSRRDALRDLSR